MTAANGFSLHIGLNRIDANHYGTEGALEGCEADARAMAAIARTAGFATRVLLNEEATSHNVVAVIREVAATMAPSDIFFLSYAGHGAQVPDTGGQNGDDDETDGRDETWCLFDRMLIDDELLECWAAFPPGSRVLVVSDSCHSGTVARRLSLQNSRALEIIPFYGQGEAIKVIPRVLPFDVSRQAFTTHPEIYSNICSRSFTVGAVRASVLLLSGCQDNQLSADGSGNGLFTSKLLEVWAQGAFQGSYRSFHRAIQGRMPFGQSPNYDLFGPHGEVFESQRPFTIHYPRTGDTQMSDMADLDPRVTKLLQANGRGSAMQPRGISGECSIGIEFNRGLLNGFSDAQLLGFFQSEVAPRMLDNYLTILGSFNPTRSRGGEVSCTASTGNGGSISCTGSIRW